MINMMTAKQKLTVTQKKNLTSKNDLFIKAEDFGRTTEYLVEMEQKILYLATLKTVKNINPRHAQDCKR